jgi:lauroyl/myristoyl acyltransferase
MDENALSQDATVAAVARPMQLSECDNAGRTSGALLSASGKKHRRSEKRHLAAVFPDASIARRRLLVGAGPVA